MKSCLNCIHFLKCDPILSRVNRCAQAEDCGFYKESEMSRKCDAIIRIVREEM